jgi:acetoacetate decarboxylase
MNPPIASGREVWGFPKKLASPTLRTEIDTLVGTLDYGPVRVATATMGYKHKTADLASVKASLAEPNFLLKIIPHVDGTPRICELVEFYLKDVDLKGAWTGPSSLNLWSHARSDRAAWRGLGERTGASRGGTRLRTRAPVLAARLH